MFLAPCTALRRGLSRAGALGFALALMFSIAGRAHAQPLGEHLEWAHSRPEDLLIKLVTFGPGDDIYNYFGHNGMIVEDRATHRAGLYNFGMFTFGLDMLPNYMKGRLTFWVAETPVRATFAHYIYAKRSVRVQELNLAPAQRKFIADALARNVLPQNREYLYHHYFNNCSTRLRDLIDESLGGQFKTALGRPARMSFRDHTRRYAQKDPITNFALVFWMNDQMEAPIKQWDELFLPEELEHQVARMHYVDAQGRRVPLVATSYTVYEAPRPPTPAWPSREWPWTLALGCAIGLLALLTAAWYARDRSPWARRLLGAQHALYGLTFGLLGTLGFLMWTLTEHTVTYHNENQLLANPITFALLPLGVAVSFGSQRALRATRFAFYVLAIGSIALLALKLLPSFDQDTTLTMTLLLPANLGGALAHRLLAQRAAATVPRMGASERGVVSRA